MTDMQLIIPPVEDNVNHGDVSHDGMANNNDGSRGVLPDELRENFESMKAIWRQARRTNSSGDEAEELRRKEREVAVETAVAVDAEISRWQTGVDELEALLAAEEGESDEHEEFDDEPVAWERQRYVIRFPSLPPVIPPEDEESVSEGSSDRGGHFDSTAATTTSS
jgi:hypothetical protein